MTQLSAILRHEIERSVTAALYEDLSSLDPKMDITAQLIPEDQRSQATIISREAAVFCGRLWADETFKQLGSQVTIEWLVEDGDQVAENQPLCHLSGPARVLLTGERTALNFIQTLSGIATVTRQYMKQLRGTHCQLLDTRKTIPGLRHASKYAVTCAGTINHRVGLYDAFLIKENHIIACGGIREAIDQARAQHPECKLEIEVESFAELQQALDAKPDVIMLDNFTIAMMQEAVAIADGRCKLEASGDVTLETIGQYARTGVDFISVGALTKHLKAVDLSMRFKN